MPPDEARRLVWADQLSESGDPRGELITIQCALDRGDLARDASLRLRRREAELLEQVKGLDGLAFSWTWTRGAIEWISIDAEVFLQRREELFEHAPFLHRLQLVGFPDDPHETASLLEEVLEDDRIDGLALGTPGDPALLVELAASGCLPRLRQIELQGLSLGMVMRNEALGHIEDLTLTNLWDPFSARMEEATSLAPRRLRLQSPSQQRQTVEIDSLAHPGFFAHLEDLELEWFVRPNVFVQGSAALFGRLRRLRLPMGLAATPLSLATDPTDLGNVEELTISFFGNEDEVDFGPLLTGEYFQKLRVLRVGPGLTTNEKVRALVESPLARTLEVLDLRRNRWQLDLELDWDGIILA